AVERGSPPNIAEFLARHPEHAETIQAHLADWQHFQRLAGPLHAATSPLAQDADDALTLQKGLPGQRSTQAEPPNFRAYEILGELGGGGMGVVYRARQKSLQRLVALKVFRAAAWRSGIELERFRNEAVMVAQLDHPHIVPIYEVGDQEDEPYFSMRLLEG